MDSRLPGRRPWERPAGPCEFAAPRRGKSREGTKQAALIAMLGRPEGATIDEVVEATGWQPHTVRGAFAGALKKRLGLTIASEKVEGRGRVYRIGVIPKDHGLISGNTAGRTPGRSSSRVVFTVQDTLSERCILFGAGISPGRSRSALRELAASPASRAV